MQHPAKKKVTALPKAPQCITGQLMQDNTTYDRLREAILQYDQATIKWSNAMALGASLPNSHNSNDDSTPMEVDRFWKGKGYGKGKGKGKDGKGKGKDKSGVSMTKVLERINKKGPGTTPGDLAKESGTKAMQAIQTKVASRLPKERDMAVKTR